MSRGTFDSQTFRLAIMTALWTVAATLMIVATVIECLILASWAITVGLVAGIVTGWVMLVRERIRLELMAELMAFKMAEQRTTTRIH